MITFNGNDLSFYNFEIHALDLPYDHEISTVPLIDYEYGFKTKRPGRNISIVFKIIAQNLEDLFIKLDGVKKAFNVRTKAKLIINVQPDRYWNVFFQQMTGEIVGNSVYFGEVVFHATNPDAYSVAEYKTSITIDASPKLFSVSTGGNQQIEPIYTLTTGTKLTETTITLGNLSNGEIISWSGTLETTDVLLIDVAYWIVMLNDEPSMLTVDGTFPHLLADEKNELAISGAGTNALLEITYQTRYV